MYTAIAALAVMVFRPHHSDPSGLTKSTTLNYLCDNAKPVIYCRVVICVEHCIAHFEWFLVSIHKYQSSGNTSLSCNPTL